MGKSIIGKAAPPLELPSIPNGDLYKLPIGEKPIALFFFPKANTKGCTMEACAFRDAKAGNVTFKRHAELEVVGISGDGVLEQQQFADQYNLPYPIVSDKEGTARQLYGVDKAFFGLADGRETFFINRKGIVTGVCRENIRVTSHTKFVEQQLQEMEREEKLQAV